jgi:hypothetical protein
LLGLRHDFNKGAFWWGSVGLDVEERAGILTWAGNHASVSATRTERVSGIQIL